MTVGGGQRGVAGQRPEAKMRFLLVGMATVKMLVSF